MISPVAELRAFFEAALVTQVERHHQESGEVLVQRRWIASVTLAMGSFMLALTVRLPPSDPGIYVALLSLIAIWIVGSLLSGPIHLGNSHTRSGTRYGRGVVQGAILGVSLLGIFLAGAVMMAAAPFLRGLLLPLSQYYSTLSPWILALIALSAVGEEIFFRGALWAAIGGKQALLVTTVVYALATIPVGNPLLILSAAVVGMVAAFHRRVTGGVIGPIVIHLIWTVGLAVGLPVLLAG